MRYLGIAGLAALAACNTPTPTLRIVPGLGSGQPCKSSDCGDVPISCRTVMSVRIFDPEDPTGQRLDQCIDLRFDSGRTLCSVASVDLDATPLPVRRLEVQVALYPASSIQSDPDRPGKLKCPDDVKFNDTTGYPIDNVPSPALGGRTYYQPGDESVVVELGCTDLELINESCTQIEPQAVIATVEDFDTRTPVPDDPLGLASELKVSVGEPKDVAGSYVLSAIDSRALRLVSNGAATATWSEDVDLEFARYVCVEVDEIAPQATPALHCRPAVHGERLELRGVVISQDTVQQVLSALTPQLPPPFEFPDAGLTIGVVVDHASKALPDMVVSTSVPGTTVKYLSNTGTLVGGATSNTGIFVSRDAPFGTTFGATAMGRPVVTGIGGLVKGHATLVVLQYKTPL